MGAITKREGFENFPRGPYSYCKFVDYTSDTDLNTTDWVFTVTGSTAPTTATHEIGGTAAFTNAAADNDRIEVDETAEYIKLGLNATVLFVCRAKMSDATQADYGFGIGIIDTDWLGDTAIMSDGVFFEKNDGDTNLDFVCTKDASSTSDYTRQAALFTCDTSYHEYAFMVQMDATTAGSGRVMVFVDGNNVYDGYLAADLPDDEELCIKFGVQNGEAVAKTLTIDYIGVAGSR